MVDTMPHDQSVRDLSSLNYGKNSRPPVASYMHLSAMLTRPAAKLIVRQDGCIGCNSNERLTCPECPSGQTCGFTIQSCTECPKAFCRSDGSNSGSSGSSKSHDGPSAGPIAGGVIGGVIVIAVITYLVWRFLIKPKRASRLDDRHTSIYEADANPARGVEKNNSTGHGRRASTHTVHSIASTVLTRASNIIQIAYIPGVTNRATPTPDVLVPPVPPMPANYGDEANGSEHFFVPGNLRDSTYSGFSSTSDRTSYAPRSSIASTIYGRQAEVQTASQAGMRAKPTVVSVKPGPNTPPVPSIDMDRFGGSSRPESSASAFSVGAATYTATPGRAQVVKVSGLKKIDIAAKSEGSALSNVSSADSVDSKESSDEIGTIHIAQDVSPRGMSPFADPPAATANSNLAAIKEEKSDTESQKTPKTGSGPFGDEHATKE